MTQQQQLTSKIPLFGPQNSSSAAGTASSLPVGTSAPKPINHYTPIHSTDCTIPIKLFREALPESSPTRRLLESLQTTREVASTNLPFPSEKLGLFKYAFKNPIPSDNSPSEADNWHLIITGLNLQAKLQSIFHLTTYLSHLSSIPYTTPDAASLSILLEDILYSEESNMDDQAQVLLCLAIISRRLLLIGLENAATDALNDLLSTAAIRIPRWAFFDPVKRSYWKGGVEWDSEDDVTVKGVLWLVTIVYANSEGDWVTKMDVDCSGAGSNRREVARESSNGGEESSYKPEAAGNLGRNITRSRARAYEWSATKNPAQIRHSTLCKGYDEADGVLASELFLKANKKDYLTELVLEFISCRFYYLRYHQRIRKLMRQLPEFTYDVLLRFCSEPKFLGCEGGKADEDGPDSDYPSDSDGDLEESDGLDEDEDDWYSIDSEDDQQEGNGVGGGDSVCEDLSSLGDDQQESIRNDAIENDAMGKNFSSSKYYHKNGSANKGGTDKGNVGGGPSGPGSGQEGGKSAGEDKAVDGEPSGSGEGRSAGEDGAVGGEPSGSKSGQKEGESAGEDGAVDREPSGYGSEDPENTTIKMSSEELVEVKKSSESPEISIRRSTEVSIRVTASVIESVGSTREPSTREPTAEHSEYLPEETSSEDSDYSSSQSDVDCYGFHYDSYSDEYDPERDTVESSEDDDSSVDDWGELRDEELFLAELREDLAELIAPGPFGPLKYL